MTKPKAMQASETFYQHHLVVTDNRRAWERLCRLTPIPEPEEGQ